MKQLRSWSSCKPLHACARRVLTSQASSSPIQRLLFRGARLTNAAHEVWSQVLQPGHVVVDATCGNGHDTVQMAKLVGPSGKIFAFDVQQEAIDATSRRLTEEVATADMPEVVMVKECHSQLLQHVRERNVALVAFNLGYLPSSSKEVITNASTTLQAIDAALQVLDVGGLLSILAYTGHEGGPEEYEAVKQKLKEQAPSQWVAAELQLLNRPTAPIMLLAWRQS